MPGREPVAFEDKTNPDQRHHGQYLIRVIGTDRAVIFRGAYNEARKIARRNTQYGDVELSLLEEEDSPAL